MLTATSAMNIAMQVIDPFLGCRLWLRAGMIAECTPSALTAQS